MRYLLITEPRSGTSVAVDMSGQELPEEALARWLGDDNNTLKAWREESENIGLVEFYESETNETVQVIDESRRIPAPPPFTHRVTKTVNAAFADVTIEGMGGGMTAWWIDLPNKQHALITYSHDDHIGDPDDAHWIAGRYDFDGEQVGEHLHYDLTLAQAIEHVRNWRKA